MADEVQFGWAPGKALTFTALQPDGNARGVADQNMAEVGATGYYKATPAVALVAGDVIIIDDGTYKVGFGVYREEVNCVLIEGSDFTDTLIGADGDTLEILSDEIAAVAILGTEAIKQLNAYRIGE